MFGQYLNLGFEHILDPNGLDHVLFIVILTAPYLLKDWKKVIVLATAFTVGHSLTLALSSLDFIKVNGQFVEICIALSILVTAIYNVIQSGQQIKTRYIAALIFGLIHGLGFSNFFKAILAGDSILLPLLAFNLGVELAQIIIVIAVLLLAFLAVNKFKLQQKIWIMILSVPVLIWSVKMVLERL